MTSFFEAKFRSMGSDTIKTQVYKAQDMEDAMRQHARTTEIMCQGNPTYTCDLITMVEVESKSKIKRFETQWNGK